MPNTNYSKVIYNGKVLIDLTGDSVTADKLASGITAHDKSGKAITGTNKNDVDTSEASASEAEVLSGQTFGARGQLRTGTMPDRKSTAASFQCPKRSIWLIYSSARLTPPARIFSEYSDQIHIQ